MRQLFQNKPGLIQNKRHLFRNKRRLSDTEAEAAHVAEWKYA